MGLTSSDVEELRRLEESLWRAETRFDPVYMDQVLAPDFLEFGRSGRVYVRADVLGDPPQELVAELRDVAVHQLADDVALVTYVSIATYDEVLVGNRSSIWTRSGGRWQLRFHQGTPTELTVREGT